MSFDSQKLLTGIIQNSDLFLYSNKYSHFSQFYFVDVEIVYIVSILSSTYGSIIIDGEKCQIMQACSTEDSFIGWGDFDWMDLVANGVAMYGGIALWFSLWCESK